MITVVDPCPNCTQGRAIRQNGQIVGYESICTGRCHTEIDLGQTREVPSGNNFLRKAIERANKKPTTRK